MYFIRRDKRLLKKYLHEPEKLETLVKEASPAQQLSYALFKLEENDFNPNKETINLMRREISPKDPFLGKKP